MEPAGRGGKRCTALRPQRGLQGVSGFRRPPLLRKTGSALPPRPANPRVPEAQGAEVTGGRSDSRWVRGKMTTLVLDNGAYNAKIGYSHENVSVIPNCQFRSKTARLKTFTANQIDEIKDPSGLFYILPFQKGYLVNWDVQRQVWDYLFGKEMYQVDFLDTNIIITEPYFNFTSIQESMNEILFEEYQFQAVLRVNAGALSAHRYFRDNPSELCCIIVDSGYSFTHIVPYCRSKKKKEAIIRINVGGKLLTNHLKEIISYRLKGEENTVMIDYVLPDFSTIKKGFCKPREEMVLSGKYKSGEQILRLANERFAVPEILFNPSDIGIQEMGIPEAIVYSIQNLPEEMQPHFFKNIVLTGGNSLFPGFRDRVYSEVRCLTPTDYDVSVVLPENPITYAWEGGKLISENDDFEDMVVTREDYEENGHSVCEEKFDI
ncbi:actin-related protein 6 isoform 2-T2 [Lycaon pictus]|uniref:actin-related protein 6 isoform X3 n=1 Tax=Vulpes lagopus TaxID=494514 RepID=UPI001BC8CD6A|nr:actin-related protein 6 isoform X3 [Vulpes lagopus]